MEEPLSEDVASIYDDLMCQGDLGLVIHNLQTRNKQLQLHVTSLEEDIRKLCNKITEMKQTQENLSRNISELFKTAKNEIERKDRMIAELRTQLDDMIFKRNTAPSNFGIKRQREEQNHSEEMLKKSRCDKLVQNNEQKKDNSVCESELSRSEHYSTDRKSDCELYKKYKTTDSRDHMKHKNNTRSDERRRESHDSSSRYDGDSRKKFNSRDRGYRSDNRKNSSRDYIDKGRRISRNKDYKVGRFAEFRELKSHNGRSSRSNRDRNSRSDEREEIGRNREFKNEPRFSPAESTRSTPEPPLESKKLLNVSREEGEVSDIEEDKQIVQSKRENCTNNGGKKISERSTVSFDSKKDPPGVKEKPFDVPSFIDKQQNLNRKKETGSKNIEKHNNKEKLVCKDAKEAIQHVEENYEDRKSNNNECMIKEKKRENTIKTKQNTTDKESFKSVEDTEEKIMPSIDEDFKAVKGGIIENNQVKTEKITIISQVVLNENKNVEFDLPKRAKTETLTKDVIRIGDGTSNRVVKLDKPRECGVPRNLTGELNINVEKARPKQTVKECESNEEKKERVQKKISSLFDTPMKDVKGSPDKLLNFNQNFELTHEGDIPALDFEKLETKETNSNQNDIVNIKETLTPVSEFQIFKTNLPSLEKSNSVSIQFQTNITDSTMKSPEASQRKKNEREEIKLCVDDCVETKLSVEGLQKHSLEDLVNTIQPVVNNENIGYGHTSEICNLSLDLLNTNLDVYKEEDFPNLTAFSESKDMPNILLTPVSNSLKTVVEKDKETSSKLLEFGNALKEPDTTLNVSTEQKVVSKETSVSESKSTGHSNKTTIETTYVNASPGGGDSRRKRKRCVIKWAE